jgi:parvulin-like peptidyl-prolyl isomerase
VARISSYSIIIRFCAFLAISSVILMSTNACQSTKEDSQVLASVGQYTVSDVHFKNAFLDYYRRTGQAIPINELTKKAVLDGELDRYVIVTYAEDQNWHKDAAGQKQQSLIQRQVLMQEYERLILHRDITADESDLRELFRRFNTRVRASHIYAPDKVTADSLHQRLLKGETFESVARNVFSNKHLKENGGDLGFFTVDEMDPAFENVAYRLNPNEVAPPVRTQQGYSIIKVTDVVTKPIITETEFANRKAALYDYAVKRNREMATRRDLEQKTQAVQMNSEVLDELFRVMKPNTESTRFDTKLSDDIIVASLDGFELSLAEFRTEAALLADWRFASKKALQEIIEGITYRSYAIQKVRNHPSFDKTFADKTIEATFHAWLIDRFNTYLGDQITIDEPSLLRMYQGNPERQMGPLQLNLAELVVASEKEAQDAIAALKKGRPFKEVLLQYGVMGEALLYDGELGFRSIDSFGKFAPNLKDLKPRQISDALEYTPDRWLVYYCIDRKEAQKISFEQAREDLIQIQKSEEIKKMRMNIIEATKRSHDAQIHYDRMNAVSLSI